jgi:hypothetical protein
VQRFVRARYPKPRLRVRRRVETPPGAQGQADWAEFLGIVIAGEPRDLFAFHLVLSHSRMEAIVWSERTDELAWLSVHNQALTRLGGVPAVMRVDNTKTAIARGAGPWGVVNERYATYARTHRFHVDATRPRAPEEKGKVEGSAPGPPFMNPEKRKRQKGGAQKKVSSYRARVPVPGHGFHAVNVLRGYPLIEIRSPLEVIDDEEA